MACRQGQTLGLDIQTRHRIWEYVAWLRDEENVTVFLTTRYMDEADHLCDRVATIDHGQIKAIGPPGELKSHIGGDLVTLTVAPPGWGAADAGPTGAGGGEAVERLLHGLRAVKKVWAGDAGAGQGAANHNDHGADGLVFNLVVEGGEAFRRTTMALCRARHGQVPRRDGGRVT